MTIPIPLPELPMDLIEEILCYVPPTSLKRLCFTCKRWNRLINGSSRFARKHKAAKQFLVIMLTKQFRICPVNINLHDRSVEVKTELNLPDPHYYNSYQFHIAEVFHCDGFLLCTYECISRVVVWNPFTGETRWFRSSKINHRSFVLGYDNSSSYKLLSYNYRGDNCEIYDFNTDSWRVLDGSIVPQGCYIGYPTLRSRVSLKGNTYWFGRDGTKTQYSVSLIKFDFSTEKAVPVPLPYQFIGFEATCLSVVRDEKLSVLLKRDKRSKTEIWVTNKIDESTKVVSWSKVLALNLSPDLGISDDGTFLLDEEKKVFVYCNRWLDLKEITCYRTTKVVIYIVGEDNKVTKRDFERDIWGVCSPAIFNYVPSLAQLKQAGSKRKRGDSCD